jgi:hypothetical protein
VIRSPPSKRKREDAATHDDMSTTIGTSVDNPYAEDLEGRTAPRRTPRKRHAFSEQPVARQVRSALTKRSSSAGYRPAQRTAPEEATQVVHYWQTLAHQHSGRSIRSERLTVQETYDVEMLFIRAPNNSFSF